jgi:hypothetical protein
MDRFGAKSSVNTEAFPQLSRTCKWLPADYRAAVLFKSAAEDCRGAKLGSAGATLDKTLTSGAVNRIESVSLLLSRRARAWQFP